MASTSEVPTAFTICVPGVMVNGSMSNTSHMPVSASTCCSVCARYFSHSACRSGRRAHLSAAVYTLTPPRSCSRDCSNNSINCAEFMAISVEENGGAPLNACIQVVRCRRGRSLRANNDRRKNIQDLLREREHLPTQWSESQLIARQQLPAQSLCSGKESLHEDRADCPARRKCSTEGLRWYRENRVLSHRGARAAGPRDHAVRQRRFDDARGAACHCSHGAATDPYDKGSVGLRGPAARSRARTRR